MGLIISPTGVVRSKDFGLDTATVSQVMGPGYKLPDDLVIVEPTYYTFMTAENDALGLPFGLVEEGDALPARLIFLMRYTPANNRSWKGYLLDVVDFYKGLGYQYFHTTHIPFEAYGAPIVGSSIVMVFSLKKTVFSPQKDVKYPRDVFPKLRYHAPFISASSSPYAGRASMSGYLDSGSSFLPDFRLWCSGAGLPCEYQSKMSLASGPIKKEDVRKLFGVDDYQDLSLLLLVTPAAIIRQILDNVKDLPEAHK